MPKKVAITIYKFCRGHAKEDGHTTG
jgi:hypothetical protein